MRENNKNDMLEGYVETISETINTIALQLGEATRDIGLNILDDARYLWKKAPLKYVDIALWTGFIIVIAAIIEIPLTTICQRSISWVWLRSMVLKAFVPAVATIGFAALTKYHSWKVGRSDRAWQRIFRKLGLVSKENMTPAFISLETKENGTEVARFYPNGISSHEFEKKKTDIALLARKFVEAVTFDPPSGEMRFVLNPNALKAHVDLTKVLAEERPLTEFEAFFGQYPGGFIRRKLNELPHLLVAGSTRSGKTSALKSILYQVLTRSKHVTAVIIDPKDMDFRPFSRCKNVFYVTDIAAGYSAINDLVSIMEDRKGILSKKGFESLDAAIAAGNNVFNRILVVVDEFADLLELKKADPNHNDQARKAHDQLHTLSRLGRATGLHLILSTQMPDKSTITRGVRANFPAILCFALPLSHDSLAVLGTTAAGELPKIPGRAIFRDGAEQITIQAPFIKIDTIQNDLPPERPDPEPNLKSLHPNAPQSNAETTGTVLKDRNDKGITQ